MTEYSGWKQIGTISIIYSVDDTMEYNGKNYPKAYVAETKNKKAVESGISWAKGWNYTTRKQIDPKIVETDNKDFSFQIISAAGNSWQGGKLSFWMCLMEKNGIKPFAVGINADILCDLILETVMNKGKTDEKVFFARKNGQLGVLHENMPSYQELLKDEQLKKDMQKGKTTKWKIGYTYKTLTQEDIMLGVFSNIVSNSYVDTGNWFSSRASRIYTLNFTKPDMMIYKCYYDHYTDDDLYDIKTAYHEIITELPWCGSKWHPTPNTKCPSRQKGRKLFDLTDTYYEDFVDTILNTTSHDVEDQIKYAFAIFKYNPEATIKVLEKAKNQFEADLKELQTCKVIPGWIKDKDYFEKWIKDWPKERIIDRVLYSDNTYPIQIEYNGETTSHRDWSSVLNKMIEITKKEIK